VASPKTIPEITLHDVLLTLWRRKLVLMTCTAVAVLLAVVVGGGQEKTYKASTDVLLAPNAGNSASALSASDAARTVANALRLVRSDSVQKSAADKGVDPTKVEVKNQTGSDVIEIQASAATPADAVQYANDYAAAFIDLQRVAVAGPIQASIDSLNSQNDAIKKQLADPGAANLPTTPGLQATLTDNIKRISELTISVQEARTNGGPRIVSAATLPTSPSGPMLQRYVIVAILAGLVLGGILCLLIDHLRRRIYRPRELDRATDGTMPNLAIIEAKMRRHGSGDQGLTVEPATREAYRLLRTMVELETVDGPAQLIQVITPRSTGHSAHVTVGLAKAAADAGQRVLVVGANFHNSPIHDLLGGDIWPGVTDVLNGDLNLTDAIQPVPGQENMWLLPAGSPTTSADYLAGKRALALSTNLRARADLVILESAPVLEFSDALEVSRVVDGTLLVVPKGSLASDIKAAAEFLANANARLLGTVLYGAGHKKPHVQKPSTNDRRAVEVSSVAGASSNGSSAKKKSTSKPTKRATDERVG
jgi:Mrp family chromosome partitioning ATPase/capsular polysaccharide biosynthesis protein